MPLFLERVKQKCQFYGLFISAENEGKLEKICELLTLEDCGPFFKADLENGYDEGDEYDKMDFINRLPYKCKKIWIKQIKSQLKRIDDLKGNALLQHSEGDYFLENIPYNMENSQEWVKI